MISFGIYIPALQPTGQSWRPIGQSHGLPAGPAALQLGPAAKRSTHCKLTEVLVVMMPYIAGYPLSIAKIFTDNFAIIPVDDR